MSHDDATVSTAKDAPEETTTAENSEGPIEWTSAVWVAQAAGFTHRTLRDIARSWTVLAVAVGLPPIMYLLVTATREFDPATKGLFAVGIAVLGAMIASLTVFGNQLAVDLESDRFLAYRSMSVSPSADLAGRMAAGLVVASLALGVGLVVGVLDGAPVHIGGIGPVAVSIGAFIGVSIVFMAAAVPIVVAANNEQYAQFVLSLVAVFAFMLTGYNGVLPSVAILSESAVQHFPNVIATRAMVVQLVTVEGTESVSFAETGSQFVTLAAYSAGAAILSVLLARWQLYDRRVLR